MKAAYLRKRPRQVGWDRLMLAQIPSGVNWVVTHDSDSKPGKAFGRMLNTRTREILHWFVFGEKPNDIRIDGACPKHCIKTVARFFRMTNDADLLKAAKVEIECRTTLVHNVAAEQCQIIDNVEHMNWFIRRVEDQLIKECQAFWHLAPSYPED